MGWRGCDFWIETVGEEDYTDAEKEEIESLLYRWKDGAPDDEDSDDDGYSYEKWNIMGGMKVIATSFSVNVNLSQWTLWTPINRKRE